MLNSFRGFGEFRKIFRELGYEFHGRNTGNEVIAKRNQSAGDIVNSALNFAYAVLEAYVMKAINAIGLANDMAYPHDMRSNKNGHVYDMMECGDQTVIVLYCRH